MERTSGVMQQGGRSASINVSEEWSALEGLPEARRFYPDAERCTQLTWKYQVDQLMGINPPIVRVAGRMAVNIGIGNGESVVAQPRRSNFDLVVIHILREAGSLSTPELHEEVMLLGEPIGVESLFRLCKKLEVKGLLSSTKHLRSGGSGRGVMLWQVVKK